MLMANHPRRRPTLPLLTLVAAAAALLAMGLTVRGGPSVIDALDAGLAGLAGVEPTSTLFDVANVAGSLPIWFALIAAVVTALARASLRRAAEFALLAVLAEGCSTALKVLIGRPRPAGADVTDLLVTSGFPSGHVTRTAVFVGAVLVLVPWAARHPRVVIAAGLVAVAVMAVARVSGQAHHTSDVLGAVLLAAALLAIWEIWRARVTASPGPRQGADPVAMQPRPNKSTRHRNFAVPRQGAT